MDNPETFLHLTATGWTALASMVNAASLLVLAGFNFLYLRAANTQARAAMEQSKTANDALGAAEKSNQIARDALQLQTRPWVGLDDSPSVPAVGVSQ